jgi:hypothetical protein
VRSGFVAFNTLAMCFAHHERSALHESNDPGRPQDRGRWRYQSAPEPLAMSPVPAQRLFQILLKTPLGDLPDEVFVVLGSSDEEPFDFFIRCVRAFFGEALPQIVGGSVVSHDHALLFETAANATRVRY